MSRYLDRALALAAAVPLLAVLPAAAQRPAPDPPALATFGEVIDVRVINVEVVVTGRDGNRVTGLAAGDFLLRVDGREVPIEYFTEVRGGDAVAPAEGAQAAVQGLASLAPGMPVGTSYLVFIDDYFAINSRRNALLRTLRNDLGRLGPGDLMAIVSSDGQRLAMLSSWSSSPEALGRALEQAMERPARGLERVAELRSFEALRRRPNGLASAERIDPPRAAFALDPESLAAARELAGQVQRSVAAATSALRAFASPPGRKVMLLLSGGWPYSPGDFLTKGVIFPSPAREVPQGEALYGPLADTANRLGYTIYAVEVPGVDHDGPDASQVTIPTAPVREFGVHAALELIADRTGGRALLHAQAERVLETAQSDTRSYYWLGFAPARKGDDVRHDVRVELRQRGLTARARRSYLDLSPGAEATMMVESALLFGNPPGRGGISIAAGEPERAGRREMEVPLSVAIPTAAIEIVPLAGRYIARLELRVAAIDERSNQSEVPVVPVSFTFDAKPEPGGFLRYDTRLLLRRRPHHLVVSVFDTVDNAVLSAEMDVAAAR